MSDNHSKSLGKIVLPKMKLPEFKLPNPEFNDTLSHARQSILSSNETIERAMDSFAEKARKEEDYKRHILDTLINIEKNTADINQLIYILNDNTEKQTEILTVITEILSIGTAKTTDEAEGMYRKIMNKITQTFEDAETIEQLLGYSKIVYHAAIGYIQQRIENG